MSVNSTTRKKSKARTLHDVLTEAINYYICNGWDSQKSLLNWSRKLRIAASQQSPNKDVARKHLTAIYSRLVVDGGALRNQPVDGPTKITLDKLKPQLRKELDKRIFAAANLITLNREQAIERTLQRFQGWVTSIPPAGVSDINKTEQKAAISQSVTEMDYISRRVAIDQGHKLTSNVKFLLAMQGGAIAFKWHSNYRRPGYNFRPDHKDRDALIYLVRDSWATQQGLIKPQHGYYHEITAAGEEVYCSCQVFPIYAPQKLPDDYLTEKGKREFNRA